VLKLTFDEGSISRIDVVADPTRLERIEVSALAAEALVPANRR
jgi:hypothetical protein